jgi:hypothetical protein
MAVRFNLNVSNNKCHVIIESDKLRVKKKN